MRPFLFPLIFFYLFGNPIVYVRMNVIGVYGNAGSYLRVYGSIGDVMIMNIIKYYKYLLMGIISKIIKTTNSMIINYFTVLKYKLNNKNLK